MLKQKLLTCSFLNIKIEINFAEYLQSAIKLTDSFRYRINQLKL